MHPASEFIFESDILPQSSFNFFEDMRGKGEYCDVVLKAGDLSIPAHSIIVAAAIPYLRETLRNRGTQMEVHIPQVEDLELNAVQSLVQFAYHCKIKCSIENVMDLLSAACRFQMDEVCQACCNFLSVNLYPENALKIRDSSLHLSCSALVENADRYVANNFLRISQTEDFLKCSSSYLNELIARDDLQVEREEDVYEAVMKWITQSFDERKTLLIDLMGNVRLALLEPLYFRKHVATNKLFFSSETLMGWVNEITDHHFLKQNLSSMFNTQQRCSAETTSCASEENHELNGRINLEEEQTQSCRKAIIPENEQSSTCSKAKLQCCANTERDAASEENEQRGFNCAQQQQDTDNAGNGDSGILCEEQEGCYPDSASSEEDEPAGMYAFSAQLSYTVQRFDHETNTWRETKTKSFTVNTASVSGLSNSICFMDCENMCYYIPEENDLELTERYMQGRATTALGDQLYVFGGSDGKKVFNTAKRFDTIEEEWYELKSMKEYREYASCVAVGSDMFVLGGNNLSCIHNTVEKYDTEAGKWTFTEPMLTGRSSMGCAALNGTIYVCGGIISLIEQEHANTAEMYNPNIGQWILIQPMSVPRLNFALVPYAERLYAVGGRDVNDGYVESVEIYDPETGKWEVGPSTALEITGAAVIQDL